MSEDKVRAEFEKGLAALYPCASDADAFERIDRPIEGWQSVGDYRNSWIQGSWEGFLRGRQYVVKDVPVEAIKLAIEELGVQINHCIALAGRDDINQPARERIQAHLEKAKAKLESFLRTIEEMKP